MNDDKTWRLLLRAAIGGALGSLIFLVFLGLWGHIFHVGTGHDQAYLIMFIFFFGPVLLLLGAVVGTFTGISVLVLARKSQSRPGRAKRLLVGIVYALFVGALAALYFGEGSKTFDYWTNFTVTVLVFGIVVGGFAGAFATKRRA